MRYKDHHTAWKELENVLEPWEQIALLTKGDAREFVKAWIDIEIHIKAMAASAVIYNKVMNEGRL